MGKRKHQIRDLHESKFQILTPCIYSSFFSFFSFGVLLSYFPGLIRQHLSSRRFFFLPVQNLKISLALSPIFIHFKKAWFAICSTSILRGETSCGWLILSRWFTPSGKLTSSSNYIPNCLIFYFLLVCSAFVVIDVAIIIWLFFSG